MPFNRETIGLLTKIVRSASRLLPSPGALEISSRPGAAVGAAHTLQAKTMFWVDIGQATFSVITETNIALKATYRVLRRSGEIALSVMVTGENTGRVQLNKFTLDCSFEPRPNVLLVHYKTADGKPQLLSFSTQKNGVLIDGDVVPVKVLVKT